MKIYYNWCWDGHIKIIESWTEIWMEYSFVVDTETLETANWRLENATFDKCAMKLNYMIEKWLELDVRWKRAWYVYRWNYEDYYMLERADVPITTPQKLKQIILNKEFRDFIIKNKLNNDIFITKDNIDNVILDIYNNRAEPQFVLDRYIFIEWKNGY